jgi:hypothetical protein
MLISKYTLFVSLLKVKFTVIVPTQKLDLPYFKESENMDTTKIKVVKQILSKYQMIFCLV